IWRLTRSASEYDLLLETKKTARPSNSTPASASASINSISENPREVHFRYGRHGSRRHPALWGIEVGDAQRRGHRAPHRVDGCTGVRIKVLRAGYARR